MTSDHQDQVPGLRRPQHRYSQGRYRAGHKSEGLQTAVTQLQEAHATEFFGLVIAATVTGGSFAVGSVSGGVGAAHRVGATKLMTESTPDSGL